MIDAVGSPLRRQADRRKAHPLNGSVLLAGRLADYKYYNMDQAAARALKLFEDEIARR